MAKKERCRKAVIGVKVQNFKLFCLGLTQKSELKLLIKKVLVMKLTLKSSGHTF